MDRREIWGVKAKGETERAGVLMIALHLSWRTSYPTRPLPAPSSTLSAMISESWTRFDQLPNCFHASIRTLSQSGRQASERTNIVFPRSSSILHWRRYLARTLPAGHNCPPQPSFRSVCRISGGLRRPEKSMVVVVGRLGGREGTRSSVTNMKGSVSSGL